MKRQIKTISSTMILILFIFNFWGISSIASAASVIYAPTSVKAASSSYNSIKISWKVVTGVSGYQIYRAASSKGTYTLISTTTGTNYNNTGLTLGTSYYYKIRAYRNVGSTKIYGNYSSIVSSKPMLSVPTSVKVVPSSYNSIKISWNGVTGASGYQIYRAISSKGTYTLISLTTGTNYNNTGLTTGTSYYYKIRAYRNVGSTKIYGNYSSIVSSKPILSAPTSVKATVISNNSINVNWGGVTGASGYEIYRSASSNGTYALISTTTGLSYNNTGLKAGTTYYYKVRAYRTVGSVKIYGSFSSIVNGTTTNPIVNVTSISLSKTSDNLTVGATDTLIANVTPANAVNKTVIWTSSDNTIATVDNAGKVTAVNVGTTTITATTSDGSKTASCIVTVSDGENTNNSDAGNVAIKGIDVSKWQGTIDWALVKSAGVQFAIIRSSYGKTGVDPYFETNYYAAKANGMAVGAYHYSYATTVDQAVVEANFFISQLKGKQFDYPVCVDVEDSSQSKLDKATITNIALTYLNMLKQAGYYPMIYANKNWFTSVLDDTMLTSYDHWLAQWGSNITYPGTVGIWQYTSAGTIMGINGNVDMDTSFVDYATQIKQLHLNGY